MSKMSELDLCIGELRNAAQSLTVVADNLIALFSGDGKTDKVSLPVTQSEPPKQKPITLEQVRALLAEKSRNGHTNEVRKLLQKHGANKLSEIDPAKYPTLLAEVAEVGLAEGSANG